MSRVDGSLIDPKEEFPFPELCIIYRKANLNKFATFLNIKVENIIIARKINIGNLRIV